MVDVDLVDRLEEKMKLIDLVMLMAYDAHVNYADCFAMVRLWDVIIYNYLKKQNIVLSAIEKGPTRKTSTLVPTLKNLFLVVTIGSYLLTLTLCILL